MILCNINNVRFALLNELKIEEGEAPYLKKQTTRIEVRFGNNVRMYRKRLHLTQEQLAYLCGLNQNYVSNIETGRGNVTLRILENMAKALGVETQDLLR